jgi:hypothetical protein
MSTKYLVKFFLMSSFVSLIFLFSAKAETCGICKDSYVSCISSGSSLSSCKSQLQSCESACFGKSNSGSQSKSSDKSWIFFLLLGCVFFYYVIWPILSGFANGLKGTPKDAGKNDENSKKLSEKNGKTPKQLREEIKHQVGEMTVAQISTATNSSDRGTIAWLLINGITCKDYDGAAKKEAQRQKALNEVSKN